MNPLLLLLGITVVGALVWKGQQYIITQPADTLWVSDPYQTDSQGQPGDGMFWTGSNPPGEAPPWRLASEAERELLDSLETTGQ